MNDRVRELVESGIHLVPPHMQDAVRLYYYKGYQPGHFLTALLSNDLMETLARGDEDNVRALREWGRFLYNHTPADSYGSPAKVSAWIASFAGVDA